MSDEAIAASDPESHAADRGAGRKGMFRSLRRYNYRVWFVGSLVSNIGTWMQSTALGWVVLTALTDGDSTAMGVTLGLQFAPSLLLVGVTGWVADRFPRRRLLLVTQSYLAVIAFLIGALLVTGALSLPLMMVLAFCFGCGNAFDGPARQAFVTDLVHRRDAPNAIALNSASFNVARLVGPAVAGVSIIWIGGGWVFIATGATYAATIIVLLVVRTRELVHRSRPKANQRILDGFRYAAKRGDILVSFVMFFIFGTFGINFPIFASTMALEFGHDADGFGLLTSILAVGSIAGALLAASRAHARLGVVVAAALLFGTSMVVAAFMPDFWWYAATCVVTGFATVTLLTTANGYIQTSTDPALRGRVIAIWMALGMGGAAIGAPIVGWVIEIGGARAGLLVGAGGGFAAAFIGIGWLLVTGRFRRTSRPVLA